MDRRAQLSLCAVAAAAPGIAALFLAGSGAAVASPAAAGPGAAQHPVILRLRALISQQRDIDVRPTGVSVGDEQVASGRLYRASGRVAGTFGFTCTTVSVTVQGDAVQGGAVQDDAVQDDAVQDDAVQDDAEECLAWGALPAGQLEMAGLSRAQDPVHQWAVTGGTGAYRGARGTLTARDLSETRHEITIRLG